MYRGYVLALVNSLEQCNIIPATIHATSVAKELTQPRCNTVQLIHLKRNQFAFPKVFSHRVVKSSSLYSRPNEGGSFGGCNLIDTLNRTLHDLAVLLTLMQHVHVLRPNDIASTSRRLPVLSRHQQSL